MGYLMLSFTQYLTLESQQSYSFDVGYHVSPVKNKDSIMQNGLRHKSGKVYVWKHRKNAAWFANLHRQDGHKMNIWKVNTSGLNLHKDPETDDMSYWSTQYKRNEDGHGYIYHGEIGPDRITKT